MPKHHYVPRMILKNFADDTEGKFFNIHLLKDDDFIYHKGLYGQAQKDDLYGSNQKIESFFGKLETSASPGLMKLKTGNVNLFEEEEFYIKLFVMYQISRTPGFAELFDHSIDATVKILASHDTELKKKLNDITIDLKRPYFQHFRLVTKAFPIVMDLSIGLLETDFTNSSFLIGQNPVIRLNPYLQGKKWKKSTQGLAWKGLILVMPISPRFSLILYDKLRYRIMNKNPKWIINSADVDKLNCFQYCNTIDCIYFNNSVDEDKYRQINAKYKNFREDTKVDSVIPEVNKDNEYMKEPPRLYIKEFPIKQEFKFLGIKIKEYEKRINGNEDAIRECLKALVRSK